MCPCVIPKSRTVAPALACPQDTMIHKPAGQFRHHIKNMKTKPTIAILTAVLLGGTFAFADSATPKGVPKDYPLKKCVVSGDPLGEHGKVVKVSNGGTDVYLCCKDCVKDFNKDPQKYTKMVKDAGKKK